MPVMKQKSIKPSTDIPYSEGILVHNNTGSTILADRLVTFYRGAATAKQGALMTVELAPAGTATTKKYPLLVTKHNIPDGKSGVVLPWKTVSGIDTSALSVGDSVFLSNAAPGVFKITAGAPTHERVVGVVTTVSATAGEVFCAPTMMLPLTAI